MVTPRHGAQDARRKQTSSRPLSEKINTPRKLRAAERILVFSRRECIANDAERPRNRRLACGRTLTYNGHRHSSLRHVAGAPFNHSRSPRHVIPF